MPVNDDLGMRMKENYENRSKTYLLRRTPVAIRIDGKAFHTFTRGFKKPFDDLFLNAMQETMKYLCENVQGCVFGYTQSDEITLILQDYRELGTSAWFDYSVQKLCSVAASMATMKFNQVFNRNVQKYATYFYDVPNHKEVEEHYMISLVKAGEKGAMFDARCFNIPKEEVANLIYWRQIDAVRNSIQMAGQAYFTPQQLDGRNCKDIKLMLANQKGINWEDFPHYCCYGSSCVKKAVTKDDTERSEWSVDLYMPLIKDEHRNYIESLL